VEVRFFGEFEAVEGGVPVPVRGAKQRTVLALLALHRGNPVSADRLIDALWGDGQVANPVNALQAQIGQLRRTLGATAIVTSDAGYALDIGPDDVDAARFEHLVARGRRLLDAAGSYYRNSDLPAGQTGVLVGLAWWALSAGQADDAVVFAADACEAAAASGDPAVQLLADTAVAAVRALADPTRPNAEAFVALAQQRVQSLSYGSLTSFTDEPDVAALAARLALPGR